MRMWRVRVYLSVSILLMGAVVATADEAPSWEKLFDGKTLDGWKQLAGSARYHVQDGMIVGTTAIGSPNSFLCTKRDFSDFILELDFKVDEGLNSGIQIRSQSKEDYKAGIVHGYQVEIDPAQCELYGKDPPNLRADGTIVPPNTEPRRWTGGIYDEKRRGWLADLTANEAAREAFRPGKWNQFRIQAIGNSIHTWINGIPAASLVDSMTPEGFIGLQVHATNKKTPMQVRWKNIRIQDLSGTNVGSSSSIDARRETRPSPTLNAPPPPNAIVLFDGANLDAWAKQKQKQWEEVDGSAPWKIIPGVGVEVVPGAGSIITKQLFSDFKLHLEFRLLGGETNGGVYLLARYELNINDSFGNNGGSPCGAFANLVEAIAPRIAAAAPPLQWQTFDIEFQAPRFDAQGTLAEIARATVRLNGVLIHDDVELGKRRGAAKRLGDAAQGPIMLQEHGTAYLFRNIWIVDETN